MKDDRPSFLQIFIFTVGFAALYWFFWWLFPLWSGWYPYSPEHGRPWAWIMYALALTGPVVFLCLHVLWLEWKVRRRESKDDGSKL